MDKRIQDRLILDAAVDRAAKAAFLKYLAKNLESELWTTIIVKTPPVDFQPGNWSISELNDWNCVGFQPVEPQPDIIVE